jgi:hypothetical protein
MKRVTNTASPSQIERTSLEFLLSQEAPGKMVEAQEKRGQSQLAESSQLPIEGMRGRYSRSHTYTVEQMLIDNGGKIIGESKGDALFYDVVLPKDWKIVPTDHSMWSHLRDEKNRTRAQIFYKAAFYDRSAHVDINCRVYASYTATDWKVRPNIFVGVIRTAADVVLWTGAEHKEMEQAERVERYRIGAQVDSEIATHEAKTKLLEHFPDSGNPAAYWDLSDDEIKAKLNS